MNKKEVTQAVADRLVLSPSLVEEIVDAVQAEIVGALARGERVTFWNFGRWEVREIGRIREFSLNRPPCAHETQFGRRFSIRTLPSW